MYSYIVYNVNTYCKHNHVSYYNYHFIVKDEYLKALNHLFKVIFGKCQSGL